MKETVGKLRQVLGDGVLVDHPLARYTTFKIGGNAEFFYEARTRKDLAKAIICATDLHIPYTVLGGGTNVLIGDNGVRGLVIRNTAHTITLRGFKGAAGVGGNSGKVYVDVDSGTSVNQLVRYTVDEGLKGLEMHLGLPGTVGGAVYMNSKWTKPEGYVGDVVYQAEILTPAGKILTVPKSYFRFAYDYSVLHESGDIVLGVVFELTRSDRESLWEIANRSIAYRRESQPQGIKTAGCTFQNVSQAEAMIAGTPGHTRSAGYLIDHAGLKGHTEGGARFSPVHANFIVNSGTATARDVVKLVDAAREAVKIRFGVDLKEEIVRIGDF